MKLITIIKKANASRTEEITAQRSNSTIAHLIDEVGEDAPKAAALITKIKALQAEFEPYSVKIKRLGELINAENPLGKHAPDEEYVEQGETHQVKVGPQAKLREVVNLKGVQKKLGDDVFYRVATVTLANIDRYISEHEQTKLKLIEVNRGARKITVEPRPKSSR